MAIQRESSNDVALKLKIIGKDGKPKQNSDGATDLQDFVSACTVTEGINMAGIKAEIMIQDSAGLLNTLNGSETWELRFDVGGSEAVYRLIAYSISSRARSNNADAYIVECVSGEFIVNETTKLFGSAEKLYGKNVGAKKIIEKIMKDDIGTKKSLFIEDSKNKHQFIACNWRAFDTIYWLAQKSIRSGGNSKKPQNGFLFWETRKGYHYKSIDSMIQLVNDQQYETKSDNKTENARLYRYTYAAKKGPDDANDNLKIDSISFPEEKNFLFALRNGSYAGLSVTLDPSMFNNSKLSPETYSAQMYSLKDYWKDMNHVGGPINPVENFDDAIKQALYLPRRIRYGILANRINDKTNKNEKTTTDDTYSELPWLQAYQHLRVESLKTIQLLINVPGNLDLYPGFGVDVEIPETKPKGDKLNRDRKYSGRYLIASLRHKYDGRSLQTEMLLYRDGMPKP